MFGMKMLLKAKPLIGAIAAVSMVSVPMVVFADASAPWVNKAKPKAKAKPRAKARAVARPAPAPVVQEPVYVAPSPAPVVAEVPAPAPAPAPVAVAAPAPAPAPVAAPLKAAKSGSGLTVLAVLGTAAVLGGILAASSSGSKSP